MILNGSNKVQGEYKQIISQTILNIGGLDLLYFCQNKNYL